MKRILKYSFAAAPVLQNFPYTFGGVIESPLVLGHFGEAILTSGLFGPHLLSGFEMAYRGILDAFAEKDLEYLKLNLEPKLINNLEIPDCRIVNEDSGIHIRCVRYRILIGAPFQRDSKVQMLDPRRFHSPKAQLQFLVLKPLLNYINIQVYAPAKSRCSILLQVGLDFKSNFKLVKSGHKENDSPETHHLQFECLTSLSYDKLPEYTNLPTAFGAIQRQLLGRNNQLKEYEWKVSDIDYHLNGNPWDSV